MRQVLKNAENPVDFTGWDEHDAAWSVSGGNFTVAIDGGSFVLAQDADVVIGEEYFLEYKIVSNNSDGDFFLSSSSIFGSHGALNIGVGVHTLDVVAVNTGAAFDLRLVANGGSAGAIVFDYFRLYKNGEMVLNSEGVESMWGW